MKRYEVHIVGNTPLIMGADRLCNPTDPLKKQISELTCLKKKKDEHHEMIAALTFRGTMYYDEVIGLFIPAKVLLGCFKASARKSRKGKDMKAIIILDNPGCPLSPYEGKKPDELWSVLKNDGTHYHAFTESVVRNRARVVTTRPIFHKWECKFTIQLNEEILSEKDLQNTIITAGKEYGLCECRPEKVTGSYGMFELESMKQV